MLNEIKKLGGDFRRRDAAVGTTELQEVKLGKGDGSGELKVPNGHPREVWARRSDTHELITVYLPPGMIAPYRDGDTRVEGQTVRIGKAPSSNLLQVIDAVTLEGQHSTGNNTLMEEVLWEALYARQKNIMQLRAMGTASYLIEVEGPYWYRKPATGEMIQFETSFLSVQTEIDALSAGQHQLAILYLNLETNALGLITATAVTATGTVPARGEFLSSDVTAIPIQPYWEPIIPVYLYDAQPSVGEADFYRDWDLRGLFGPPAPGAGERLYLAATYPTLGALLGGSLGG